MAEKRFTMKGSTILECGEEITAWDCCDLLNELYEENQTIKNLIKEAYETERTQLGKSVLKQLIEKME